MLCRYSTAQATVYPYNKSKDEWIFRCESDITVTTDWYAAIPKKKWDNAIKVPANLMFDSKDISP